MQLAEQLHAAGLAVFPCYADKGPAVPKGCSWANPAYQFPNATRWPSGIVGLPVPPGVVVVDLDTYKGVTREAVERLLGGPLPWDAALMQQTARGGEHYAFRAPAWTVNQGSDIGLVGLDTRVGGKGYVATGEGYSPAGFGVFAMAHPHTLPVLPDICRDLLEVKERSVAPSELPHGARDTDEVLAALACIPPSVGRSDWVQVGLGLRHHYHDDEATGLELFRRWSAGELHADGEPHNYDGDTLEGQFLSFKPEGATTIGTLFHKAMSYGWRPPATVDVAAAFGAGAAPTDQFCDLVDDILASGCNPKDTDRLLSSIQGLQCSPSQSATLLATLTRELKDAGLLTKAVRHQLDTLAGAPAAPQSAPGEYAKNDTCNAALFLDRNYPDGRIVRVDDTWYRYDSRSWVEMADAEVKAHIARDMSPVAPQASHISGAYTVASYLATRSDIKMGDCPDHLVLFLNGVLNLATGELLPHSPTLHTTNILPYDFNPRATCPAWLEFLENTLEGDQERVALLQEWLGYSMVRSYRHHKIMLMVGPKRCGKGTIGKMLAEIAGARNFAGGSLRSFCRDDFLESVRQKTVVFVGDADKRLPRGQEGQVIEALKMLSGNDQVTYGRKYKSSLSEALPCRLTIASNHIPNMFDDSGALSSRVLLIPFNVSFYGRENLDLQQQLSHEVEGIAMWALQGLARLNWRSGFTLPEASKQELDYLIETYSPLRQFTEEVCVFDPDADGIRSCDLYDAYKAWALAAQETGLMGPKAFVSAMKDVIRGTPRCGYLKRRYAGNDNPVWGFYGMRMKPGALMASSAPALQRVK